MSILSALAAYLNDKIEDTGKCNSECLAILVRAGYVDENKELTKKGTATVYMFALEYANM